MKRSVLIFIALLTLCQSVCANEIWYTTTNAKVLTLTKRCIDGSAIESNTYKDGRGVIVCSKPIKKIDASLFQNCTKLQSITLPNGVLEIGGWAFHGCKNLQQITLSQSLIGIGDRAFEDCTELKNITLPNSLKRVTRGAFTNCPKLESFSGKYTTNDHRAVIIDGVLIAFAPSRQNTYAIPQGVSIIGECAFSYSDDLQDVIIPNSVTEIEHMAFVGCRNLRSISLPNSVKAVGSAAFAECTKLQHISLPQAISKVAYRTFAECKNLSSITIPNRVVLIEEWAFKGCRNLATINLPKSLLEVEYWAFQGCSGLKEVYSEASTPPKFRDNGKQRVTLYVPAEAIEKYRSCASWCDFTKEIRGYDFKKH